MKTLPEDAVLWGNALDFSALPDTELRPLAGRAAASCLARAAECGCDVHWTNDLFWLQETLAECGDAARQWAPLRAEYWPDARSTSSILVLTANGGRQAFGAICVRRFWIEGDLGQALRTAFGAPAIFEDLVFDGDLARDVSDCHIAWACGLWRHDTLRGKRIGAELVTMAALDALARWQWSWFLGMRRESAQQRLGLAPFDRLEARLWRRSQGVKPVQSELVLVAGARAKIRRLQFETAGAA
jgi:hypothetical protein